MAACYAPLLVGFVTSSSPLSLSIQCATLQPVSFAEDLPGVTPALPSVATLEELEKSGVVLQGDLVRVSLWTAAPQK